MTGDSWLFRSEASSIMLAGYDALLDRLRDEAHKAFGDELKQRREALLWASFQVVAWRNEVVQVLGEPVPGGPERPELADEPLEEQLAQRPTREIVRDGLVGRHANDENRTRKLTPHRHRAAS